MNKSCKMKIQSMNTQNVDAFLHGKQFGLDSGCLYALPKELLFTERLCIATS